jgi:hypothetical protein
MKSVSGGRSAICIVNDCSWSEKGTGIAIGLARLGVEDGLLEPGLGLGLGI